MQPAGGASQEMHRTGDGEVQRTDQIEEDDDG
jgi:hypothetical protein